MCFPSVILNRSKYVGMNPVNKGEVEVSWGHLIEGDVDNVQSVQLVQLADTRTPLVLAEIQAPVKVGRTVQPRLLHITVPARTLA